MGKLMFAEMNGKKQYIMFSHDADINDYIKKYLNHDSLKYIMLEKFPDEDLLYFDAWELTPSSTVVVNMPKARDIHRQILRPQRDAKFAPLDGEFMKALEKGDTVKQEQIATQKQKLRDITAHPAIESAQTADDLRKLTLDVLLSM
jgi:hypothetical protein